MSDRGEPFVEAYEGEVTDILAERADLRAALDRVRAHLRYISCPTMGLPGGADPAEFAMDGATEYNARYALQLCIQNARLALAALDGPDLNRCLSCGSGRCMQQKCLDGSGE